MKEAIAGGKELQKQNYRFDMAYTSVLKRAIKTCNVVLEEVDQLWIPVVKAWQLNERHYGALQGLNKQETVEKHGIDQVKIWRRSYDIPPPECARDSEYYPGNDPRYASVPEEKLPTTESLKTTLERVLPYWDQEIAPQVKSGKKILIAAHGNSLRALVKYLDDIPESVITELNIPTGIPLVYELDENLRPIKHKDAIAPLSGHYLGNQEEIRGRIDAVANQTKAK